MAWRGGSEPRQDEGIHPEGAEAPEEQSPTGGINQISNIMEARFSLSMLQITKRRKMRMTLVMLDWKWRCRCESIVLIMYMDRYGNINVCVSLCMHIFPVSVHRGAESTLSTQILVSKYPPLK